MGYFALTYIAFYIIVLIVLSLNKLEIINNKSLKVSLFLFAVMLGCVTFYFKPFNVSDLYRQYERIEKLQGTSFSVFSQTMFNDSMWGESLIYWIFSHFKSVEYYPFFFTIMTVGIALLLIIKPYYEKVPARILIVAIMIFFAGNNFSSIFGGVRNCFVNGIIVLCLYEMIVEHKKKIPRLIIIFFSCVIHISGIVTLLFAWMTLILKEKKKIIFLILPLFYSTVLKIISEIPNGNVQFLASKMKFYFEDAYALSPRIITAYFLMLLFILLSLKSIPDNLLTYHEIKYKNIVEVFTLFGCGSIFAQHIMVRQAGLCCCAVLPLVGKIQLDKKKIITYILLISGMMGIVMCFCYGFLVLPEAYRFILF